jgi:hypothetical protein
MVHGVPVGSTRPSIGSVIVVSVGSLPGSWLRSKNAIRPTLPLPW